MSDSLEIFSRASIMLLEADTIQKAKELKSMALTAADWAKRKGMGEEAILHCRSYALEAERKMGHMLLETERHPAGRKKKNRSHDGTNSTPTLSEIGVSKNESARAQDLADMPEESFQEIKSGKKTRSKASRDHKKKKVVTRLEKIASTSPQTVDGTFDVVVVDPPWPMEKIERDCRPNQVSELDYPVMSVEDIINLHIGKSQMHLMFSKDAHVFIWTTHRFIRDAFKVLDCWSAKYCATFVWKKPGGFQPCGLPQFNCEFCLYGRVGSPIFTDTKAFNVCFEAPRGKHSEKPEEFYELLRRVTSGRRLDVFNRRKIEGFIGYGNEAK